MIVILSTWLDTHLLCKFPHITQTNHNTDHVITEQLQLERNAEAYYYLAHSKCSRVDTINDAKDYKDVLNALKLLGFEGNVA